MKQQISPSILSADFARLSEEIKAVEKAGAHRLHIDVMDGIFTPHFTIGPVVLKSIRPITRLPLDVHLMAKHPKQYIASFIKAGAASITIHVEAEDNTQELLNYIKSFKVLAGVSLNPRTPAKKLFPFLKSADIVLIMTVQPGAGGQKFLTPQAKKIRIVKNEIKKQNTSALIQVDGGINNTVLPFLKEADVLVSGNFIFKHKNYKTAVELLTKA